MADPLDHILAALDTARPLPDWWSTDEWATPPDLLARLADLFGPFDLDPCARDESACADQYYTITENGLVQPWFGCVFVNPPYSDPEPWIRKAVAEVDAGRATSVLLLLPSATDTGWFHEWIRPNALIHFLRGRVQFLGPGGVAVGMPRWGSIVAVIRGIGVGPSLDVRDRPATRRASAGRTPPG